MKASLIFIAISFLSCKNSQKESENSSEKQEIKEVKSSSTQKTVHILYLKYLNQLETIVDKQMPLDHSDGFKAVAFLSEISGYAGNGNQSYYGTIGFEEKDLTYWKEWYKKNKDTLNYFYKPKDTLGYDYNKNYSN